MRSRQTREWTNLLATGIMTLALAGCQAPLVADEDGGPSAPPNLGSEDAGGGDALGGAAPEPDEGQSRDSSAPDAGDGGRAPDGGAELDPACQASTFLRCASDSVVYCSDDGRSEVTTPCPDGCSADLRACTTCTPDSFIGCDGTTIVTCDPGGRPQRNDCGSNGCNPLTRQCNSCVPGAFLGCDGDTRVDCGADGLTEAVTPCPTGCNSEAGQCNLCQPGAEFVECQANSLISCSDDGMSTVSFDCSQGSCTAPGCQTPTAACNTGGYCNVCVPNSTYCQGSALARCSADGRTATHEACAFGCREGGAPRCADLDPSNRLGPALDAVDASSPGAAIFRSGKYIIDTSTLTITGPTTVISGRNQVIDQADGSQIAAFGFSSLTIESGATVQVQGGTHNRALALVVSGDITIDGKLLLSPPDITDSRGGFTPGAGARGASGNGQFVANDPGNGKPAVGGGGGGGQNGYEGGQGGMGGRIAASCPRGGYWPIGTRPPGSFSPLVGGASGGLGSAGLAGSKGGGGGGAVQLVARGVIRLGVAAQLFADGGGGQKGLGSSAVCGGGGGGGSGGTIVLEASDIVLASGSLVRATGGGGGGGYSASDAPADGSAGTYLNPVGGHGEYSGGEGNFEVGTQGDSNSCNTRTVGGGGGGGGGGRIAFRNSPARQQPPRAVGYPIASTDRVSTR